MMRRIGVLATALTILAMPQMVGAQSQVGPDYFDQPTKKLVNFDRDPSNSPIASGTTLQLVYSSYGIFFDGNDRAVALDDYGTSAPNQATGSSDEVQNINVYFQQPADAAGAWGYDFVMRAFDVNGGLILEASYTDGRPCPRPANFREQRFLGIAGDRPIHQVQYSRYYTDQVLCGFRIDDFQFLRQEPPRPCTPVVGNVQIAWNSCLGTSGWLSSVNFDCNNTSATYDLVGTFQLMNAFPDFITLGVSMDVVLDGQTGIAPFWHMESGGCNSGGVGMDDNMPAGCTGFASPWGPGGASSDAILTAYQAGYNFPNYGRLLGAVARASNDPTNLAPAPANYYGWTLRFVMDQGGACAGCDLKASLRINNLALFDNNSSNDPEPGSGYCVNPATAGSSPCVAINGGGTLCDPTTTRNTTWGRLKSMYR